MVLVVGLQLLQRSGVEALSLDTRGEFSMPCILESRCTLPWHLGVHFHLRVGIVSTTCEVSA